MWFAMRRGYLTAFYEWTSHVSTTCWWFVPAKEKLETAVESLPMSTSKSSEWMLDKLDLCTWFLNLRTWTLGFSFEAFKTTYMDEEEPRRKAAFSSREYCFPLWGMIEISVIDSMSSSLYLRRKETTNGSMLCLGLLSLPRHAFGCRLSWGLGLISGLYIRPFNDV